MSDAGVAQLVACAAQRLEAAEGPLPVGLSDALRAAEAAARVQVPGAVVELLAAARRRLGDVSDRRLGQAVRMLQTVAASCGRDTVELCDCWLLQHVLWSRLEVAEDFRQWLRRRVAQRPGRALASMLGGLLDRVERCEPRQLAAELENLRKALEHEIGEVQRSQ